jgi:queuine tRNA-ribosyltransferase
LGHFYFRKWKHFWCRFQINLSLCQPNNRVKYVTMKFDLLKKRSAVESQSGHYYWSRWLKHQFYACGYRSLSKRSASRELKEDINPILSWETPTTYICVHKRKLEKAGGLHKFMNWERNIWRWWYQVYSLSANRKLGKKAKFKSHIDGSYHFFTPENVMEIQRTIGADIIIFDECTPYPCDYNYAKRSMKWPTAG